MITVRGEWLLAFTNNLLLYLSAVVVEIANPEQLLALEMVKRLPREHKLVWEQ
jgi:hypothetical protein